MKTSLHFLKFLTCLLFSLPVISTLSLQAQNYQISFAGSGVSTTVATVKVENLTRGTSLSMNGSDVLHLMGVITGIETVRNNGTGKVDIYPNPMKEYSSIQFLLPEAAETIITLYDFSGKKIAQTRDLLSTGQHTYKIQGVDEGIYLVSIRYGRDSYSGRLISSGSKNCDPIIVYENTENTVISQEKQSDSKGTNEEKIMQYTIGDRLKLTGISGNYSTVMTDVPTSSKSITFNFIACTDGDGNNYPVVKIGNQVWMAENLKTTKYNDGTDIPLVKVDTWGIPGFRWYNDDSATYKTTYGALYNWFTVNTGKLCPIGWHVPTDAEWYTLALTIDPEAKPNLTIESYVAGGKLKETGLTHWQSPNTGATNESGFTALPGGYFGYYSFFTIGESANWWSATQDIDNFLAWCRYLGRTDSYIERFKSGKLISFSVRCIKGN